MRTLLLFLLLFLTPLTSLAATVERIEIEGLKWTKKEFVERELLLKPGDQFSEEKLRESVRNLLNTHLFYRVEPEVIKTKKGVIVKLRLKERFPIVPLPKLRVKSSGAYRAGLELRDYNLLGMGHKLYIGYVKWFNSGFESYSAYSYLNLYRVIRERGNVYGGVYYFKDEGETDGKTYSFKFLEFPVGVHFFLDERKVNQVSLGLTPSFLRYSNLLRDKNIYYLDFSYVRDLSTDMVYFVKGGVFSLKLRTSLPQLSDLSTWSLELSYKNSVPIAGTETKNYRLGMGTKLGYSGEGYRLRAPVPGYTGEKLETKRYIYGSYGYRIPVIDRSVYFSPELYAGNLVRGRKGLLLSGGFELTAFWAKLVDGIIRFKLFRGLGRGSDTQTSLRLTFRW